MKTRNNGITRYLVASAYKFNSFRNSVIDFFETNKYISIAQSYGINIPIVVKNCRIAKQKQRTYKLILLIPGIIFWSFIFMMFFDPMEMEDSFGLFVLVALIIFVLVIIQTFKEDTFIRKKFKKNTFVEDENGDQNYINIYEGNVVYYSGYSPFVGFGVDVGGWSFAIDIDNGKKNLDKIYQPQDFEINEIYEKIEHEIRELNIPQITIDNKLFINGKTIRDNKMFLPNFYGRPVSTIPEEELLTYMNSSDLSARFYQVIQVSSWDGDLILTILLRFLKKDKNLFAENSYFIIPPIDNSFKFVDSLNSYRSTQDGIALFFEALVRVFTDTISSIFGILKAIAKGLDFGRADREMRKVIKNSPDFDFGAKSSIRENISQNDFAQHFQKLDKEMYFKIMQKRIFNTIGDFLDEKNIDNSEFKERETNILNNGVIVTGGNVKADSIAVGKGSKILNKTPKATA